MDPRRLLRADTLPEVSVLALMSCMSGGGCLAWAAFPPAPDAPRMLMLALGGLGLAVALALVLAASRATSAYLHATVLLFVALTGVKVAVAVTERGLLLSALGFTWTAVYVAFFFRPATARAYAALMTTALGVSLLVARAPTDVSVWITISAMIWTAIAILTRLNARLKADASTDSLTGLLNRAGFAQAAARQRAMAARHDAPLALAVIDLDAFKVVNDRDGHTAGDRLLVELAEAWTATLRPGDLLARFGGDEFVLLIEAAESRMDDVLARLAQAHPAAWTAGAVVCGDDESLDQAIDRADARLYVAKEARRGSRRAPSASAVRIAAAH